MTIDNTTAGPMPNFPTPACVLRAAAAYVVNHGVHQPSLVDGELCHVDWSTNRVTPAASPEGAIRMVVFGRPTLDRMTRSDGELYWAALESYLLAVADGGTPPTVMTVDWAASALLWGSLCWELDELSCPGCDGPVCGLPNDGARARIVVPVYRHFPSMTPLCGTTATAPIRPVYHRGDQGRG